jgi:DNA-binding SARP family transcriptional activator
MSLLGGFDLHVGDAPVSVPLGSKRLLAFVALHCRAAVPRALIAGRLWPHASEESAYTNLRAALSRLRGTGRQALHVCPSEVRLAREISVDLHHTRSLAQHILDPRIPTEDLRLTTATVDQLSADLLPGWYDDWALMEAENWRQLRLHALEALAENFIDTDQLAGAVTAAQTAVRADPLRESSHAVLIRAHLAENNPAQALHEFTHYTQLLDEELGLRPTPRLHHLVSDLTTAH